MISKKQINSENVMFTVVYPGAEPWLADLLDSLEAQSNIDFDWVIVNDGLHPSLLPQISPVINQIVYDSPSGLTPSLLREKALLDISKYYSKVLFVDADDLCMPTRSEILLDALKKDRIVCHNLSVIDKCGETIRKELFCFPGRTLTFWQLIDGNYCGFSNMGVHTSLLRSLPKWPHQVIAVDWWLFSMISMLSEPICVLKESLACYRQHGNNIANILTMDDTTIRKGLSVKSMHYNAILQYRHLIPNDILIGRLEEYASRLNYFLKTYENLVIPDSYLDLLCPNNSLPGAWWQNIPIPL